MRVGGKLGEVGAVAREQVNVPGLGERAGDAESRVAGEDVAPVADGVNLLARVPGGDEKSHGGKNVTRRREMTTKAPTWARDGTVRVRCWPGESCRTALPFAAAKR